ncbi:hypothetical protein SUGI_0165170 [Cryptomeria japonica]|nr:hypothetical protein SUGI_0165170 [Cryptomeria japonica]
MCDSTEHALAEVHTDFTWVRTQHLGHTGVRAQCLGCTVTYVLRARWVRAWCHPHAHGSVGTALRPDPDENTNRQKLNSNSIATPDEKLKKGATPGLPRRSPILVLLRPKCA